MNYEEIMSKQESVFHEVFEDKSLKITADTDADDIDEWDSLSHITLVMEMENAFGVRFALGELAELQNVGDMANLILKKLQ